MLFVELAIKKFEIVLGKIEVKKKMFPKIYGCYWMREIYFNKVKLFNQFKSILRPNYFFSGFKFFIEFHWIILLIYIQVNYVF